MSKKVKRKQAKRTTDKKIVNLFCKHSSWHSSWDFENDKITKVCNKCGKHF